MKITPQTVIFVLFVCGVIGVYDGEVKTVSVTEGDSVTLNPNLTEKQILWKFGSELIAQIAYSVISYKSGPDGRFRNRLQLDSETGSLTITNMRMKHSGLFELEVISSSSGMKYKRFNVSVYESPSAITVEAEMKSEYVMAGESLTLQIDAPDPHGDQLIVWRFGDEGKLIAKADLEVNINSHDDTDERFRDRLKLNNQDGSLTIKNTRNTDSGLYMVKISSSKQTLHKRFIVTVSDSGWSSVEVAGIVVVLLVVFAAVAVGGFLHYRWKMGDVMKVMVNEGNSATLRTAVTELQTGDEIEWSYGDSRIAEITGGKEQIYDVADERFSGKLTLDKDTGDLNISKSKFILSGLYKLKITRKGLIRHKRFNLTVNLNIVPMNVGKSLTLSVPSGTDLEEDDLILWKFGPKGSAIATFSRALNKKPTYDVSDERFRDGLNLDEKTGSLTIRNITTEHAGVYQLQLCNGKRTTNRKYRVTIPDSTEKRGNEEKPLLNGEDLDKMNEHSI